MTGIKTGVAAGVLALSLVSWSAPSLAAQLFTQSSCNTVSGVCATFGPSDTIPTIRTISFNVPTVGTALVTFNGTLYCAASGAPIQDRVVDFITGITTANSAPSIAVPGSLRVATVLKDEADHLFDTSLTFNLSSTRTIPYNSTGRKTVSFKIARARQDANTSCTVYGGTFSVLLLP